MSTLVELTQAAPTADGASLQHDSGPATIPVTEEANPATSKSVDQEEPKKLWLHGTLYVEVLAGYDLPLHKNLSVRYKLPSILDACLGGAERMACGARPARAYVTVEVGKTTRARTNKHGHTSSPKFNERFEILVADPCDQICFNVKDDNWIGAPHLGRVCIPVERVITGEKIEDVFPLREPTVTDGRGRPVRAKGSLKISLQFKAVARDPIFGQGVGGGGSDGSVPNVYFPMREGCRVTLYSNSMQEPDQKSRVTLANDIMYEARSCWLDIYRAMENAKILIYLTGWSTWPDMRLVRDPALRDDDPANPTLTFGDLLKKKAAEGVRVCMLVWDDKSSFNSPLLSSGSGVMGTHDEETRQFFKGSSVHCKICKRNGGKHTSLVQRFVTGNMFTHHQKSVLVDVEQDGSAQRRLISFVGGLDLCNGRYDTQRHSLFHTLGTIHAHDFHQACIAGASHEQGGPREPWHDIHSRLEGPIAWDVLHNFVQRWRRQAGQHRRRQLLDMKRVRGLYVPQIARGLDVEDVGDPQAMVENPDPGRDTQTWNVQFFRSIDSTSAEGLPSKEDRAYRLGLMSSKGNTIDFSIQEAYVHAIRRAQRYIYIENQYFLGSSHAWDTENEATGANHLVCVELALKIVSKIRAGERFTVYVVLPMWSEGVPDTASVQEILHFQTNTMRMMYTLVADALREKGLQDQHPTDYLFFFCLGNRELPTEDEYVPTASPPADSPYESAQKYRRFMIYVHSKLMIVDDEFIILGSANINQRSLDGARDTEMAVGAFQPAWTMAKHRGKYPQGQIHGFRLQLWEEHTRQLEEVFSQPESLDCMKLLQRIGQRNWDDFVGEEVMDLQSHLLNYPIQVSPDGHVDHLPGHEHWPDFPKASILGGKSATLPDTLTS
ncbi:hypothetical protein WJX72_004613 [[Myrmecia] bisecta]|uniref:Phospholipase D n=1 Tax=[Myrmecia] bisecta TaxID=41462 RepID=A0AAW1R6E0_9CHLO